MQPRLPMFDSKTATVHTGRREAVAGTQNLFRYILTAFFFMISTVQAGEMVSVEGATLNMRAGSGTRHPIVWEVSHGYPLLVIGKKGNWLKVRDFENDEGWVYRSLTAKAPHHIVKSRIANIRSAPDTKSRIVAKAKYGDVFRTLENRSGWVKIKNENNGLKGWVARRLLWGW